MANLKISPIMKVIYPVVIHGKREDLTNNESVFIFSCYSIMANVKISPIMKVYLSSVVIPSWQT